MQLHRRILNAVVAALALLLVAPPAGAAPGGAEPGQGRPGELRQFLADHPDATQVAPDQVAWHGGDVVMTFPSEPAPRAGVVTLASAGACDSGWSCLYEHPWYGGRKLQFRSCGYTQSLAAYGFANQATSWVNNRGSWTRVLDGGTTLWTEYGYAQVGSVAGWQNDRADSIHLHC